MTTDENATLSHFARDFVSSTFFIRTPRFDKPTKFSIIVVSGNKNNYIFQYSKNTKTGFYGVIFPELFQFNVGNVFGTPCIQQKEKQVQYFISIRRHH